MGAASKAGVVAVLFAIELPDRTTYLVPAENMTDAIEEAKRRSGVRPAYIWVMEGARRRRVYETPGGNTTTD
jgi:hypothetical protein